MLLAEDPSVEVSVADKWRTSVVGHEGHWDLFGNHVGPCFHSAVIPLVRISEEFAVVG